MSLEPNSVRLQRLTKTMDLTSPRSTSVMENHSELVKLPALRAINKGIKYNDITFTTSRDLNKLKKEPDQIQNIEEASAHHSLVIIRKRYDNISKDRQQTQQRVDKLQIQHNKLTTDKNNFESAKSGGKNKVGELDESLKAMKLQLQEADIERKIMQSMIQRIKKDKVVYDLRKYNMQKELQKTKKLKKLIGEQSKKMNEEDSRTQKLKTKMFKYISNQKNERDSHLNNIQSMLNEKEDMVIHQQARGQQMKDIALATLQDKDIREKNWYKCYLCHRLVQKLLRDKMHKEMMKFNTVQVAFKNIKTSTGVSSAEVLVKKFLTKEDTYGDLLGKIAENEKMISVYKAEGEELRKEEKLLESQQQQLNQTKKEAMDLSNEEKEFNFISNKSLQTHSYQQKMMSWLNRNFKKFDLKREEAEDQQKEEEVDNILLLSSFKKYLQNINKNLQELADIEVNSAETNVKLDGKNCRIKFTQQEAVEIEQRKYYDEEDFIDGERTSVIRNNQKFMKELKRRAEQAKKAAIEALPKKKEAPPAEKPKPVPVEGS